MTLDDLLNIGNEAAYDVASEAERMGLCPSGVEMGRARIAAVVRALRDEMDFWALHDCKHDVFDEILASDGEVKAAGASIRKGEGADGSSVTLSDAAERIATPAAAPDVCVWTLSPVALGFCSAGCQPHNAFVRPINNCHLCGKPIKFVGAAR